MKSSELEKMARLEDWYWWFVGRRYIVRNLLQHFWKPMAKPPLILDLGCGTGGLFSLLRHFGRVIGLDASLSALQYACLRGGNALVSADGQRLPFTDATFDLVAVLDVLEHLEDDEQALREIWRVLKRGGAIVFTVPAFISLWSVHDIALAHRRRYSYGELKQKLQGTGFGIQKLSFAICPLLPVVFVFRKIQNWLMSSREPSTALIELPDPLNQLLIALLQAEAFLILKCFLPFGVSLVGIAKKPLL